MVHVTTPRPSLGAALGQGINQVLTPRLEQQYQRGLTQEALQQVRGIGNNPNATPFDLASSLISATAGIPGAERYVGQLFPVLMKELQARQAQNVNYAPQDRTPERQQFNQENQPIQVQQLPAFGANRQQMQQNQFFPSNLGPNQEPGNLPQAATEGRVRPVLDLPALRDEGKRIARESTREGIPMTPAEGFQIAKENNEENKLYNANVEKETQARKESQREYGNIAVEKLEKVLPGATDEQKAYFKRKGEEIAGRSQSEADTERTLAKEATKFKNTLSNIENDIPPARTYNKIFQETLGTGKEYEKAKNDLRLKLDPLLKEGLYDTARNLLSKLGYYPEEREGIITDLGEGASKAVSEMPQIKKIQRLKPIKEGELFTHEMENFYTPQQHAQVNGALEKALTTDPSANLILLRREFEKKGIDWREFKDNLNELVQQGKFSLNDDQSNQLRTLDQPPLNNLEKILHGLKIIGR